MFGILNRYIFREAFYAWLAVTGVLLLVLLSNQFARVLGMAASGEAPAGTVFTLLGLTSLQYLTILVPVGLFLALMLALARIYRDSEMAAILACGVSPLRLYRPLMLLAVGLAALLTWLALEVAPWAARMTDTIRWSAASQAELRNLEPGRFTQVGEDDVVFYAERVDEDGTLNNVFIQRRDGDEIVLVLAAEGEQLNGESEGIQTVVLRDGKRYEGVPGSPQFRIVAFEEHGIPFEIAEPDFAYDDPELRGTRELVGSNQLEDVAELQWRLSMPLSVFVLTVLAVPLSRSDPRQGRYGKLAIAVAVYLLYSNLLAAARVWMEKETVPREIGLWWVHVVLLLGAVILLWRQGVLSFHVVRVSSEAR